MEDNIQHQFDEYAEFRRQSVENELIQLKAVLDLCESPIEQKFLLDVLGHYSGYACGWNGQHILGTISYPDFERFNVRIYPQQHIEASKKQYRADFVFVLTRWEIKESTTREYLRLIVEIDGHEFHEKTKAQAKRDKKRDRDLVAEGLIVLHFTGSEVYYDSETVLSEIDSFISKKAYKVIELYGY